MIEFELVGTFEEESPNFIKTSILLFVSSPMVPNNTWNPNLTIIITTLHTSQT